MPRRLPKDLSSLLKGERDFETKGFQIGSTACIGMRFKMGARQLVVVKAKNGYVACSYIDLSKADEFRDAAALVPTVSNFDELLQGKIVTLTKKAEALGVKKGMTGREALEVLNSQD